MEKLSSLKIKCIGTPELQDTLVQCGCKNIEQEKSKWHLFRSTVPSRQLLQLDFWTCAENYSRAHAADIDAFRQQDADEEAQMDSALQAFLAAETARYSSAVQTHGAENVLVLEPLIDFSHASVEEKRINWVLEELYARLPTEALTFPLDHCTRTGTHFSLQESDCAKITEIWNRQQLRWENMLLENFRVAITLKGNRLVAQLITDMDQKQFAVAYRLLRNGVHVDTKYEKQPIEWTLSESGIYCVQAHLSVGEQRTYTSSYPVEYFTPEDQCAYQEFLKQEPADQSKIGTGEPPLCKNAYPFRDFLVLSCRTQKDTMKQAILNKLPQDSGFHALDLPCIGDFQTSVITDAEEYVQSDYVAVLSGTIRVNRQFINGDKCIPTDVRPADFFDAIGAYSSVICTKDCCTVNRDFFQCEHLFYYQKEDKMFISNSYHLLLTALASVAQELYLNVGKALAELTIPGTMLLSWNFTKEMDIQNVTQLPVNQDLCLTQEGWEFRENACGQILKDAGVYHEESYRRLLKNACNELTEIATNYFAMPQYQHFVVDLTGGADSRLVVSALLAAQNKKEFCIKCDSYQGSGKEDICYAVDLCNRYHLPFNTSPIDRETLSVFDDDLWKRSHCMGTCFEYFISQVRTIFRDQNTLNIKGVSGEITTRPFKTMNLLQQREKVDDVKSMIAHSLNRAAVEMITDYTKAGHYLFDLYQSELGHTVGASALSQMECYHFAYSHGFHCDFRRTQYLGISMAMLLQSKTMFQLNHMTLNKFRGFKFLFDIQQELNPELAALPYNHSLYNESFKNEKCDLLVSNRTISCTNEDMLKTDIHTWTQAQEVYQKNGRNLTEESERLKREREFSNLDTLRYTALINNLRELLTVVPELEHSVGNAMYYFAVHHQNDRKNINYLYNKVTSLLDQLRVIGFEKNREERYLTTRGDTD